jgi:hypothetical protein
VGGESGNGMKAEPVRKTVEKSMREARGEEPEKGHIGLVENPDDVAFQCATCDYFEDGKCTNPDPELEGEEVEGSWCCNLYEHPGMKTVVA